MSHPDQPTADVITPDHARNERERAPSIVTNASAMVGGEISGRILSFIAAAYLSRRLGVEGYGVVGFALAFAGYFGLFVRGGVPRIAAREVARAPERAPSLVVSLTVIRVGIAAVVFAVLWIVAGRLSLDPQARTLIRLAGLLVVPTALDASWAHRGLGHGWRVAASMVAAGFITLVVLLLRVKSATDIGWVPVAMFLGDLAAAVGLLLPLAIRARAFELSAAVTLFKSASVPAATNLVRIVILSFDVVLLGMLGRLADVGAYTAAYRICFLVTAVAVAVHTAFWPAAARADGPEALGRVLSRSIDLAATACLPLVVGGIVVAGPLMQMLFGREFVVGGPMLQWLLVGASCLVGHSAFSAALIASGATRRELAIMTTAAVVNVLGNLAVIPRYGANGAAVITALSEGIALLLCIQSGRQAGWRVNVRGVWPSAGAAAVMGIALLLVGDALPVLLRIAMGGVVYVVALRFLGIPAELDPYVKRARQGLSSTFRI